MVGFIGPTLNCIILYFDLLFKIYCIKEITPKNIFDPLSIRIFFSSGVFRRFDLILHSSNLFLINASSLFFYFGT